MMSSTIVRWLKTCLQEAGINIDILNPTQLGEQPVLRLPGQGSQYQIFYRLQIGPLKLHSKNFITEFLKTVLNPHFGKLYCLQLLQTYMLILRQSLLKCNRACNACMLLGIR